MRNRITKPATQSSNYYKTDRYRASQAVNGNTKGVWYTSSITQAATIGAPEMVPVSLLKDKPLGRAGEIE
jgi:hypothetical protein